MLFVFIATVFSKPPIVLVPGTMGSILKGNITNRKTFWYCPSNLKQAMLWISKDYCVPPLINCLGDWLSMQYDSKTKDSENQDGVDADIVSFGGVDGISYLDESFNITSFIPYFNMYIEYLQNHGYSVGKDLFGAPFDWRRGLLVGDKHYARLKTLIENAYKINSNTKVSLVGHSLGGYLIHYFLSNMTTPEWREKYIRSAILVAPSIGGSATIIENLWNGALSVLSNFGISSDVMAKMSTSLGSMYDQIPNFEIFGDKPLFYNKYGQQYTAREIPQLLKDNGKFRNNFKIWNLHKNVPSQKIKPLDVPTVIVYNDQIPTPGGYDDSTSSYIYSDGDALINAEGPKYACNNWKSPAKLICENLATSNFAGSHIFMLMTNEYIDLVLKYAMSSEWTLK